MAERRGDPSRPGQRLNAADRTALIREIVITTTITRIAAISEDEYGRILNSGDPDGNLEDFALIHGRLRSETTAVDIRTRSQPAAAAPSAPNPNDVEPDPAELRGATRWAPWDSNPQPAD